MASLAPVGIFMGQNVDDSAGPPTYERNRFVADLVLNYACAPFLPGPDNVLATSSPLRVTHSPSSSTAPSQSNRIGPTMPCGVSASSPVLQGSDGRPAFSPKLHSTPPLSVWTPNATSLFSASTHLWYADSFPPVGIEEMAAFHDEAYLRYLSVRESLSEVDEFSSVMKRRWAESRQPASSSAMKRSSVIAAIEGDPVAARALASEPHPLRLLPDLDPLPSDADHGLNHDATPFVGMWKSIQATVSGTLTAVRWLTETGMADEVVQATRAADRSPQPRESSPLPGIGACPVRTVHGVTPLDVSSLHTNAAAAEAASSLPSPSSHAASPVRSPTLHRAVAASTLQRQATALGPRWAALHWFGGRHHAARDQASGFCYVNDVVLGAMALHRSLPRGRNKVLIVDLDAHHGDGTQAAFLYDPNYYVLSVHAYGLGLFPQSGAASEIGKGAGTGYTANVTLPEGATDALMVPLARQAVKAALHTIGDALGAVVLVCGADGLQGDEVGKLNYTIAGLQCVTRLVVEQAVLRGAKLLVLGAGGYVDTSTARLCSAVTRDILSAAAALRHAQCLSADGAGKYELDLFFASPALTNMGVPVPDGCEYFTHYGPSFLMHGLPNAKVPRVDQLEPGQPYYKTFNQMMERGTTSRRSSLASAM